MAKVTGPLLSMEASGSVAGTMTFAKWKGRPYVRQLVIPANPKSGSQTGVRAMMKFLSQAWAGLSSMVKATWDEQAAAGTFSPFNAYTKANMARWGTDAGPTQEYPAAEMSTPVNMADLTPTGGVRSVSVSVTTGTNADSWGVILCRSTVMGFTPSRVNAIALLPAGSAATVTYLDTPLDPGTYYYRAANFNNDGIVGTYVAEESATVT